MPKKAFDVMLLIALSKSVVIGPRRERTTADEKEDVPSVMLTDTAEGSKAGIRLVR